MILVTAVIVVLVLLGLALLPVKRPTNTPLRNETPSNTLPLIQSSMPEVHRSLRQQQLEEEASALSHEYQRRADEIWLEELRGKAATILLPDKKSAKP